jgi:YD repeat-containing protein
VGRVKRERAFDGTEHRTVYDAAGRPSTVLGPANRAVKLEHDALGRLVKRTLRDDEEAYAYDPRGLLVEARTKATTVRFERDALGRIVRERTWRRDGDRQSLRPGG